MDSVKFTAMADGTRAEYEFLDAEFSRHGDAQLADTVLEMLGRLRGPKLGYQVDRYTHSLQTATRARRDGADEEMVVCALLHDVGDLIAPRNHDAAAAAILHPYVSDERSAIVAHHGIFQGYYNFHHLGGNRDERERFRGHPWFDACAYFCEHYDQPSFDPGYDTLPLDAFAPAVRRVLGREAWREVSDRAR